MKARSFLCVLLALVVARQSLACPIVYQGAAVVTPYVATPYVPPVKYVEKVVPVEVFTPVFVPTFAVSYVPPPPPTAAQGVQAAPAVPAASAGTGTGAYDRLLILLEQIEKRQDALEARITGRAAARPPSSPPPSSPRDLAKTPAPREKPSRLWVLVQHCANCHTQGRLDPDTTFALLDAAGNELPLSDKQELKVRDMCYSGQMPPKDNKVGAEPLTDEEYAALVTGKRGGR